MAGISGRIGTVAFAKQSAKGTPASAPIVRCLLAGSPSLAITKNRPRYSMTDSGIDQGNSYTSSMMVSGDIPLYAHPSALAYLSYYVTGVNVDSGTTPNYTHTMASSANDFPWITVWRNVGNTIIEKFTDCKVTLLRLESSAGAPVTVTVGIVGVSSTFLTSDPVLTPVADNGLLHMEAVGAFNFAAAPQLLHRFSLEINNGVSGYQADDYTYSDVDPGGRVVSMSFATRHTGATAFPDYRAFYYGSDAGTALSGGVASAAFDVTFTRNANLSWKIALPQFVYNLPSPQPDPSGAPLEIDVPCEVEKPSGGNIYTITVKDQNTTAAA